MELGHGIQGSKLLVARGGVRIGIVPPLELVTCSHVFSPQLPLNQTCKLSSPNKFCLLILVRPTRSWHHFRRIRLFACSLQQALHHHIHSADRADSAPSGGVCQWKYLFPPG